jgi:bacteriocin-like protein
VTNPKKDKKKDPVKTDPETKGPPEKEISDDQLEQVSGGTAISNNEINWKRLPGDD